MAKVKRRVKFDPELTEEVVEPEAIGVLPLISKNLAIIPIHLPIILYGMFHYGLTSSVKSVMVKGYFCLFLCQAIYGMIIHNLTIDPNQKKRKKSQDNSLLLVFSSLMVSVILSVPILVILILFGAPLSSHLTETFILSNHLSLIVTLPPLILFKLNFQAFVAMFKVKHFFKVLFSNPLLFSGFTAIIFTWLGVIPIPLDWDRPWQNWPITLLMGGYVGFCIGTLMSISALMWWSNRIESDN